MPRLVASSRAAGVVVELDLAVGHLPEALGRTVFRVVQESLTNVHKHASGAATVVHVRGTSAGGVTVVVANRRPLAADSFLPESGSGLTGLWERVELQGGTLRSGPMENGGWRVRAWLPWPPALSTSKTALSGSSS